MRVKTSTVASVEIAFTCAAGFRAMERFINRLFCSLLTYHFLVFPLIYWYYP